MAQGVTYADLRFVRNPPGKIQQEEASEAELTYENVQAPRPGEENAPSSSKPAKEWSSQTWYVALALVAGTCLLLLATAVGFGVRYWQVSRQLRQESRAHAADSGVLERRIHTKKESLEQAQRSLHEAETALNATRATLLESWADGNRTWRRLQQREEELRQANLSLAHLQEESRARSCQKIGCCPRGWTLFRWKCLWISPDKKNWPESKEDCRGRSSQLVILKAPWNAEDLWAAKEGVLNSTSYWIGLTYKWQNGWNWFWVDGSRYEKEVEKTRSTRLHTRRTDDCALVSRHKGPTESDCSGRHLYICEKAARPSSQL